MSQPLSRQEILLESGTNEMEIMEFFLGAQSFGINVHKLREIIPYEEAKTTSLPDSLPSVLGLFMVRGKTIPLISLGTHLQRREPVETAAGVRQVVLVCEFNDRVNGFLVDGVNQIHRVCWKDVQPMSTFLEHYRPRFTGSIHIEQREILIVDLEHIIAEVDPEMGMAYETPIPGGDQAELRARRGAVHLMVAEDSTLIRSGILKVLTGAGYAQVSTFVDGEECYAAVRNLKQKAQQDGVSMRELLQLVITDIEMPKMDGLTLCRKIKEELGMGEVRVLIFSSLVNEQMILKCQSVGADGCITKPQIPELVKLIDGFCLQP
jgi:two-component system, chemotaxis family, chemotaxis protein CheV